VVVLALALVLLIGFMLIGDSPPNENEQPSPTGTRLTASERG
jgi:hypothetical protein